MQLIVTAVHRAAPRGRDGTVRVVDWESRRVIHEFQPPSATRNDLQMRGRTGYRGVCFADELCSIASADAMYGYDQNWQLRQTITHPLFNDLHEIAWDGTHFWVTASGIDALLKLNRDGDVVDTVLFGALSPGVRERLDIPSRHVDLGLDYRETFFPLLGSHVTHVNGIQIVDGRQYATLFHQGAVVELESMNAVFQDRSYYGCHSGRIDGDYGYLAASHHQALLVFDSTTGEVVKQISVMDDAYRDTRGRTRRAAHRLARNRLVTGTGPLARLARVLSARMNPGPADALPGWARGIAIVDEGHILIGSAPASVALVDVEAGRVVDRIQFSDRVEHAVFAVEIDPRAP